MEKEFATMEDWVKFSVWAKNKKMAEESPQSITGIIFKPVYYKGEVCSIVTCLSLEDIKSFQEHPLAAYA